jgi:DNA-binding transcriptional MerR regulator
LSRATGLTKIYYRIGEVAGIVGVEPHVLRYWETEFRSVRPQKSAKGQRVYTRNHIETLLKVKDLLYGHRFTIAGARRKLRQGGVEPAGQEAAAPALVAPVAAPAEPDTRMREALLELRSEVLALIAEF